MKVLIVGGGAREHAMAWACAKSDLVDEVFVAPGNGGTAKEPKVKTINIAVTAIDDLVKFAIEQSIDLTIIGPEEPLTKGIVGAFQDAGLLCFGPSKKCSILEESKIYTKVMLNRLGIPTALHRSFSEYELAEQYIKTLTPPFVIKPDGLTGGKGVVVAHTMEDGLAAAHELMVQEIYGDAGKLILVEEFLGGREVTFIAVVDGHNVVPLEMAMDHKTLRAGGAGPMTGGMGAISPVPNFDASVLQQTIMNTIAIPLIRDLEASGMPYVGFLYLGLKICAGVPHVLEINVRLGDPEGQSILLRLESDFVEMVLRGLYEDLASYQLQWSTDKVVGVVAIERGYPGSVLTNHQIHGLNNIYPNRVKVFHGGTQLYVNDTVFTSGGRVLTVCGKAPTYGEATSSVYDALFNVIHFENMTFREDIGGNFDFDPK